MFALQSGSCTKVCAFLLPLVVAMPAWGQALTFGHLLTLPAGSNPSTIGVGDLDQDGRPDVLVLQAFGSGLTFRGLPNGSLQPWGGFLNFPALSPGRSLVVGKTNSDNWPDCVVAPTGGVPAGVWVLPGDGSGFFTTHTTLFGSVGVTCLTGGDLNADGFTDIVGGTTASIRVFLSDGTGGYLIPTSHPTFTSPNDVSLGDIDGDGDLDIVAACVSASEILLLLNQGGGVYGPATTFGRGWQPDRIAVLEYDQDGVPDLIVRGVVGTQLLKGLGSLQFAVGPQMTNFGYLSFADLNMDGRVDLLGAPGGVALLRNIGGGAFAPPVLFPSAGVADIVATHLSGDARPRILATSGTNPGWLDIYYDTAPDCNGNGIDDPVEVASGQVSDCDGNGVPDSCQTDCDNGGTPDVCQIAAQPSLDLNQNGALDSCEPVGTPYCFGDGTGAACPCDPGQAGPVGGGCANATGNGGRLRAVGNAQVALDSVTMNATGLDASAIGMLFQGTAQQASGLGSTFGDGLLCANGTITRLIIRAATNGAIAYGRGVVGDPSLATAGNVPAGGGTLHYQVWYRDSAAFCTALTYNLTNGVTVSWTP